jgi:NADH-quinone oxidoreductase subunit E
MARVLSQQTKDDIEKLFPRYPTRMAALIPALHLAQAQVGHISEEVELDIAELLDVPPTRVREVATFYTMFHTEPAGRHTVRICRNLSCQLRGAEKIMAKAKEVLGIDFGETTKDGRVTLEHEECLAACGTGPALWCDDHLVENLDEAKLTQFLGSLK